MKPREMKKPITTSQMTLLPKPLKDSLIVRVPVRAVAIIPSTATAPMGRGLAIIPTMVATKIASRRHALMSTPSGGGTNQIATPTSTVANSGMSLALGFSVMLAIFASS